MKYTLNKSISGIRIVPTDEKSEKFKAIVDYTVSGEGVHNGTKLPINSGVSVEIDIPSELVAQADQQAESKINETYKND